MYQEGGEDQAIALVGSCWQETGEKESKTRRRCKEAGGGGGRRRSVVAGSMGQLQTFPPLGTKR